MDCFCIFESGFGREKAEEIEKRPIVCLPQTAKFQWIHPGILQTLLQYPIQGTTLFELPLTHANVDEYVDVFIEHWNKDQLLLLDDTSGCLQSYHFDMMKAAGLCYRIYMDVDV